MNLREVLQILGHSSWMLDAMANDRGAQTRRLVVDRKD